MSKKRSDYSLVVLLAMEDRIIFQIAQKRRTPSGAMATRKAGSDSQANAGSGPGVRDSVAIGHSDRARGKASKNVVGEVEWKTDELGQSLHRASLVGRDVGVVGDVGSIGAIQGIRTQTYG